jgi:hypothetical protein
MMKLNAMKRFAIWSASITMMLYGLGLGGCSLRSIGAGLLSDFLTGNNSSPLTSTVNSALGSLLSQVLGTST